MGELPTPYRDAAHTYRAAGWIGVLPIPYRSKKLLLRGWTGHGGAWPSGADIQAWTDSDRPDEGGGNIALRLPPDVIGIDVDAYGAKTGAATLAEASARWGDLPPTWLTTARDDGVSGIRLYLIPEGLRWPGQVGPGIETIHSGHRYAMVWPSLHPEGRTYRWYRPDGIPSTTPPKVEELPDLPDTWIIGLSGGELAEHVSFADLTPGQSQEWIARHSTGPTCRAMAVVRDRMLTELPVSAHESLRRLMGLIRLAEQGHTGLLEALGVVHQAFLAEATRAARGGTVRDRVEADGEWRRSLAGAVRRVLGAPSVADGEQPVDPCLQPFAGLVATPTATAVPLVVPDPTPSAPSVSPPDGGADSEAAGMEADGAVVEEHTSWWPRDLAVVLSGENTEPPPQILARTDDLCLFYTGKVNGLLGESESGKTWVALLGVAQAIEARTHVLYLDFEDAAAGITARLRALGVPDQAMIDWLTYVDPDESLHVVAAADLQEVSTRHPYAVIVLDGVNAAMSLLGLELESNTDATRFAQTLLRPLARTGAAVVTIDHVAKNKETRGKGGIGAQAKRAMVTGCSIAVDVASPFGRGQTGRLRLTVDKDRGGHVRGNALHGKNVGTAVLTSDPDGSKVTVAIEPPDDRPVEERRSEFRPTGLMSAVSRFLSRIDGELSGKQIEDEVSGKATYVRAALGRLVEEGYVARHAGPRGALLHRHVRLYTELADLVVGDDD